MKTLQPLLWLLTVTVMAHTGLGWSADEPLLKGKTISYHVKQLENKNRGRAVRAARALSEAPKELWGKIIPIIQPLLKSDRKNTHAFVAQALGNYGPMARSAVKDLIPLLKGTQFERTRATSAKALGLILKDAKHDEEVERATVALTKKFNSDYDKYSDVRRESVRALGMIGPAAKSCIPKLTKGLTDFKLHSEEHTMVRHEAAWTCGRMGPLAKEHMDRLISMMHKEGEKLPEIVWAIGQIGAIHDNVVPNIVDKLEKIKRNNYRPFTFKAMEALTNFGPKSEKSIDLLRLLLRTEGKGHEARTVIQIFKVFEAVGKPAKSATAEIKPFETLKGLKIDRAPKATPEQIAEVRKMAKEIGQALSAL